ncbi:hypothetical protein Taro_049723 [Colocasia esculenta]|uniref:Uncharacterized protein n=1 Tax=Colocasia esculenta TaxID=4460 RepID=A0A843XBT6_COLES|nr:hypothetical protein [Colocasia esculenta]
MASRSRRGGAPAREDEPRRDERAEQQGPAPQGPVLPPPPPVDYGVFMQGLVQAMQTQAHTQATLQAQLEAQTRLVAFDHRTLDEALSATCRQEGEMEQYLEEKKASQKRPAATFQRQDKKKTTSGRRPDWRQYHDVDVVSASTLWTTTLTLAFRDVDANFFDLHALQSPEFREQATPTIGELSPTV